MRGLPFPSDAVFVREESHEYASPAPYQILPDLQIDPSLASPVDYEPVTNGPTPHIINIDLHQEYIHGAPLGTQIHNPDLQKYFQGPQGDPFAPQLPQFLPVEEEAKPLPPPPPPLKPKRRRKPKREQECGFCQGNDERNRNGEPERMASCDECGRSGHASCMELDGLGEILCSYPWKCAECKTCEVCHEKGDDARILFCDNCDRGWHMYCLEPPIQESPPGSWFCPLCPALSTQRPSEEREERRVEGEHNEHSASMDIDPALAIDPALQEPPALPSPPPFPYPEEEEEEEEEPEASSPILSHYHKRRRPAKGQSSRSKTTPTPDLEQPTFEVEEDEYEEEIEVDNAGPSALTPAPSSPSKPKRAPSRRSTTSRPRNGVRARSTATSHTINVEDIVGTPISSSSSKRMRFKIRSPAPPDHSSSTAPQRKVFVRLRLPMQGKGKGKEDPEDEDPNASMFDELLNEEDRETFKTSILARDKDRFEKSRLVAENKLAPAPPPPDPLDIDLPGPSVRSTRSVIHQLQQSIVHRPPSPTPSTPATPYPVGKDSGTLRIRTVRFGPYDIQAWYDAPFPEEFSNIPEGRLWMCEFCLKYIKSKFGAHRHRMKCKMRHPPGDEIYRNGNVSVFEVDGRKNKIYCQNLCLLSKMFLDHKSLFYDVEPFLFYVMAEADDIGARFIGYFSKEKHSPKDYNVSCIMTLPVRQRRGWGNLLIDFSYLLSKKEGRTGTPERPLSALGALGYKTYWTLALMRYLQTAPENPRFEDISKATSMKLEDIFVTLQQLNMITVRSDTPPAAPSPGYSIRFSRRRSGIPRKYVQKSRSEDDDKSKPLRIPTNYDIHWDEDKVQRYLDNWEQKGYMVLKADRLKWTPYITDQIADSSQTIADQSASGALVDKAALEKSATPAPAQSEAPSTPMLTTPIATGLDQLAEAALILDREKTRSERRSTRSSTAAQIEQDARVAQLVQDEAFAQELSRSPSANSRRLRSQARPSTTRTSSSVQKENSFVHSPTSLRSNSRKSTSSIQDESLVDVSLLADTALAESYNTDDLRPRRQLRSAASALNQALPEMISSDPSPPKLTPRKRRRIESPPESPIVTPVRDKASSALNGSPHTLRSTRARQVNGAGDIRKPIRSLRSSLRSTAQDDGSEGEGASRDAEGSPDVQSEADTISAELNLNETNDVPMDDHDAISATVMTVDVKTEELESQPATLNGRYSAPSDKTAVSPNGNGILMAAEKTSTAASPKTANVMPPVLGDDLDAEGEEDEDAEGEPDPEIYPM